MVVLGMVGLAILYWPVRDFSFLRWDDATYITARPTMHQLAERNKPAFRQLLRPETVLAEGVWEFLPLRDLSYGFDAYRGGLSPRVFHQTNLLLHLLAVLMCFLLLRFFMAPGAAIAGALIFGIHPLVVEPVAWISGRKELLYAACTLGALAALLHARKLTESSERPRGRPTFLFLFVLLSGLAFVSKGPAVVVIPMAALIIIGVPAGARKPFWVPFGVVAIGGAAWLWFFLTRGVAEGILRHWPDGAVGSIFRACGAPARALQSYLLPIDLSPSYGAWTWRWYLDPHSWVSVAVAAGLFLLWRMRRLPPSRYWLLAGLTALALVPTAGLVSANQVRADRFAYLFCALASGLLMAGMTFWLAKRRLSVLALISIVGIFGFVTKTSLPAWQNDISLWKSVYSKDPDHALANGSLGAFALESGHLDLAERLIRKSLKKAPGVAVTWNNLGFLALHRAKANAQNARWIAEAERAFSRAASLDAKRWLTPFGLAQLAMLKNDSAAAERFLRQARSLPTGEVQSTIKLANLLWSAGRKIEAWRSVDESRARLPWEMRLRRWLENHPVPRAAAKMPAPKLP